MINIITINMMNTMNEMNKMNKIRIEYTYIVETNIKK